MVLENRLISILRREAEVQCDFDFGAFEDYREISEAQLPTGHFFDDELKRLRSDHHKQYLTVAFLGVFSVIFAMAAWVTSAPVSMWVLSGVFIVVTIAYPFVFLRQKSKTIDRIDSSIEGLMRGVVVCKTTIFRGRGRNRSRYVYASVLFPESMSYIKCVYQAAGPYRSYFQVGDKVAVYKLVGEQDAEMIPTTHLEVPAGLIEKATTARKSRVQAPEFVVGDRTVTVRTVSSDSESNPKAKWLIVGIIVLVFVLPMLVYVLNVVAHFVRMFTMSP